MAVINWNRKDLLRACLESLAGQTYPNFEVIVVDNGSNDGSAVLVRELGVCYPVSLRLIENSSNRGFCAANNQAIDASRSELVALLNNDAEADPDWLASLVAVLTSLVLVDRVGRRPILLCGIATMIVGDGVLIAVFAAKSSAVSGFGYAGLLMFTMGFTFGFGALVWVYAGESFPAHLRSLGSSAMLTANLTANAGGP